MKKLLIALAAGAAAIGLRADVAIGGAGFDSADTADKYSWTSSGEFDSDVWVGADAAGVMTRQTTGMSGFESDKRPAGYNSKSDNGFMALKTTLGNPVTQYANKGETQRIGDGFYYDGLVKFTAFDETPDLDAVGYADKKIAIFPMLESDADDADAYLCINAGGNATNLWKTTKVIVPDTWYRVTIKMIANANRTGATAQPAFVVFIDGTAVDCTDAQVAFNEANLQPAVKNYWLNGQLFASLDAASTEVTGVLYDGQGALDEVGFTDAAGAPSFATTYDNKAVVEWATANITKVYVYDGEAVVAEGVSPVEYTKNPLKTYYYYYDAAPGYISKGVDDKIEITTAATVITTEPTEATFVVGEGSYATWAEAVAAAAGDVTITIKANYTMDAADLAASINNATGLTTIDFAGNVLTGDVQALTAIKFIDTDENGCIVGVAWKTEDPTVYAVEGGSTVYVEGGTFDGWVMLADAEKSISGGKFKVMEEAGAPFTWAANVADGYKADGTIEAGYWTIRAAYTPTFSVDAKEHTTAEVTINEEVVTEVPPTLDEGDTWSVTFKADTGYELNDDAEATQSGTAGAAAITVTGPTAKAAQYAITVTAGAGGTADSTTYSYKAESQDVVLTAKPDANMKVASWTLTTKDGVTLVEGENKLTATLTIAPGTTDGIEVAVAFETAAQPLPPEEPKVVPDADAQKTVDTMNENKATLLKAPDGVTFGEGERAIYEDLFVAKATSNGDGTSSVAYELSDSGLAKVEKEANDDVAAALEEALAATDTTASFTVEKPIAGLYYALKEAGDLTALTVKDVKLAGKEAVTFTLSKEGAAKFWQVIVSPKAIEMPVGD